MRGFKDWLIFIISILVLLVLQSSFFSVIMYKDTKPDLLLLAVISAGLIEGPLAGAAAGVIAGIIFSFASVHMPVFFALLYGLGGYLSGVIRDFIYPDNIVIPLLSAAAGTVLSSGLFWLFTCSLEFFKSYQPFILHFVPLLIVNCVMMIPVFMLYRFVLLKPRRI